jgi:hypothetical protein
VPRRAALLLFFGGLAIAAACLPDISPAGIAAFQGGGDAAPPVEQSVCGDGVIDLDAGEQCDPGDGGGAGCTPSCAVDCPDGSLVDTRTHHCYFTIAQTVRQDQADQGCRDNRAHLVTFTSEAEYGAVAAWGNWDGGAWVGLVRGQSPQAYVPSAMDEPGWAVPPETRCDGCYAHVDAGETFLPALRGADGGRIIGPCVIGATTAGTPWYQFPCDPLVKIFTTICEREPVGTHLSPCAGNVFCLSEPATLGAKRYIYVPTPGTAADAEADCQGLGGTLFVADTREERDQVAHDLAPFAQLGPLGFWIGLSSQSPGRWIWDDGAPDDGSKRPSIWGDQEPVPSVAVQPVAARAFMKLSTAYDTQLAHAAPGTQKMPYLCEIATTK